MSALGRTNLAMPPKRCSRSSSLHASVRLTLLVIVAGSRPDSLRSAPRAPRPCARTRRARWKARFQPSAWRATMPSVTFSPPPPTHSGSRACTGFGSQRASTSWKNSPSKSTRSPRWSGVECTGSLRRAGGAGHRRTGTGCRTRRTPPGANRRPGRGRRGRRRAGRSWRSCWRARRGAGTRRSTRGCRTAPTTSRTRARVCVVTASRHCVPDVIPSPSSVASAA